MRDSHCKGWAVTTAEIAWKKFTETFGEAIALHWQHGDRATILKLIGRARELLQDYYDELPRGRTPAEQAFPRAVEAFVAQLEQMEIELGVTRHQAIATAKERALLRRGFYSAVTRLMGRQIERMEALGI